MSVLMLVLGFVTAVLIVPAGITTLVQCFTRRKFCELIRNRRDGGRQ